MKDLTDIGMMGISAKEELAKQGIEIDDILYGSAELNLNTLNLLYLLERHYSTLLEGRFLDLFCGNGLLLQAMVKEAPGLELYGVDGNPQATEAARMVCPTAKLAEKICPPLPYEANFFHIVHGNKIMDYADTQRGLGNPFPETFSFLELSAEIYRVILPRGIYVPCDDLLPRELVILNSQGFLQQEKSGRMLFEKR